MAGNTGNAHPLISLRGEIDKIDEQIVLLLAIRMDIVNEVAEIKKGSDIPVIIPERIEEVVVRAREKAGEYGVSPDLVEDTFRKIINHACEQESEIIGLPSGYRRAPSA